MAKYRENETSDEPGDPVFKVYYKKGKYMIPLDYFYSEKHGAYLTCDFVKKI